MGVEPFPVCPGFGVLLLDGHGDQDSKSPTDAAIRLRYARKKLKGANVGREG